MAAAFFPSPSPEPVSDDLTNFFNSFENRDVTCREAFDRFRDIPMPWADLAPRMVAGKMATNPGGPPPRGVPYSHPAKSTHGRYGPYQKCHLPEGVERSHKESIAANKGIRTHPRDVAGLIRATHLREGDLLMSPTTIAIYKKGMTSLYRYLNAHGLVGESCALGDVCHSLMNSRESR